MKFRLGVKIASLFVLCLLVVAVFLLVALLYADPTKLKNQIEVLAAEKNIDLDLHGDVSWSIFPNIQLMIHGASAESSNPSRSIEAEVHHLSFAFRPLSVLGGEPIFLGFEIEGADISIETFQSNGGSDSSFEQTLSDSWKFLPRTTIADLALRQVDINLIQSGEQQQIEIHRLTAKDLSSDGTPFEVDAEFHFSAMPLGFENVEASGYLALDPISESYSANMDHLAIWHSSNADTGKLTGFGRFNINLDRNYWLWETSLVDLSSVGLSARLSGTADPLTGSGQLEANISDLTRWAAQIGGSQTLSAVDADLFAFDTEIFVSAHRVEFDNIRFRLDSASGKGSASYGFGEQHVFNANLALQNLDLDAFLPGQGENSRQANSSNHERVISQISEMQDVHINATANSVQYNNRSFNEVSLAADLQNGRGGVKLAVADIADGTLALDVSGDLSESNELLVELEASALDLPLLVDAADEAAGVQGELSLVYQGAIADVSRSQWLSTLEGLGQFSIRGFAVTSMNIEQALCQSAELVGATPSVATEWPDGTVLGDVTSPFVVRDGSARVESLNFGYGNLSIEANANLNLLNTEYGIGLEVSANGTKTSPNGCNLNKYAQSARLPLQCHGNFHESGGMSCAVDANLAERLVLQQLGGQLIEEVLEKLADGSDESSASSQPSTQTAQAELAKREEIRALLEGLLKDIDN